MTYNTLPSLAVLFILLGLFSSSALLTTAVAAAATTRMLQTSEDFDSINQLFSGNAYIELPNVQFEETGMSLNLKNPICKDIEIGDIGLTLEQQQDVNNNKLVMILQISGLNMNCVSDFDFSAFLIPGSGKALAYSTGNVIETRIEFTTPSSFNEQPPTLARILSCNANIEINNLEFEGNGGLLAPSLDLIEKPFRNLLEGQIEKVICDEINALSDPLTNTIIPMMDDFLEPHLIPLPASRLDPLFAESTLLLSSSSENNNSSSLLVNFQELLQQGDNSSSIMNNILTQAKEMLTSPTGYVNTLLRENILDQDGCLTVNMTTVMGGGDDDDDSNASLISRFFNDTILFQSHNDFAEMSFTLKGVRICGLDETLENLEPLEMIGNYTMRNSLHFNEITMDLYMLLNIKPSTLPDAILKDPDVTVNIEEENVVISLGMKDLHIAASTLIAIQQDELLNLPLGSFLLETSNILPCLVSALHQLELAGLDVTVGELNDPTVSGFVDQGVQRVLSEFMQAMVYMYRPTVLQAIPNIFQGPIRDFIQDKISQELSNVAACPEFSNDPVAEAPTFLDFRDLLLSPAQAVQYGATGTLPYGDLIQRAVDLAKANLLAVDPETGLATINAALVRQLTESQSSIPGRISFPGSLFDQNGRIQMGGLDASFSFRAYNAYIDNLDSIGAPLSILDPVMGSRSELNNTASFGIGKPLQAGLRIFMSLSGKGEEIRNHMEISFDMDKATVLLTALLKISESAFFSYPLKDLTNTDCLLMMIPPPSLDERGIRVEGHERTAGLAELIVNVAKMNLNITCLECSGPVMKELEDLLSTPEASDAATATVNDIFNFATKLLGGTFMQVQIDRMLNEARLKCPSSPEYDPLFVSASYESFEIPEQEDDSTQFLVMLGIAVGVIIVTVLAITLFVKLIVRRRHRKWIDTVSGSKAILLWDRQTKEQEKEAELNKISNSMFTSSAVPLWLRLLMPAIIIANILFFLSGHLSLAATVNIVVQLGGQTILFDNFFEFSMMKSTIEIWNAGGKELAILIMIFSVIWPYTKQVITMALWFMPPRFVSMSRRESILLWLDALGKWSMVDIMTLIVTVVGFRVSINSPDVGFLPENIYSIDLLVAPLWGTYANLIAQIISQISSHFIIHYHRRIQEQASQEYDRQHNLNVTTDEESDQNVMVSSTLLSDSPKERLYDHTFIRPHRGESDKLTTRRGVNTMLIATGFALSSLVLVGCIVPSFSLEILGMVGILVESGQGFEQATVGHSVFSVVSVLMQQAAFTGKTSDYIGLGTLSVVLISTVLLVPLALVLVLLYQWMQPLSTRRRYRCEVLVEALQAWQYADVYIVSVIVASWQLGPVSEYMVNASCGSLEETFAQLVFYGIMKEEDAQCFKINSGIEGGSFALAAGAVLLALLSTFVTRAVGQYFRDKENEARRGEDSVKLEALVCVPEEDVKQAKNGIKPVPVLFTDTFRWFLIRQDNGGATLHSSPSSDESGDGNRQEEAAGPYSSYEYSADDDDDMKNVSME